MFDQPRSPVVTPRSFVLMLILATGLAAGGCKSGSSSSSNAAATDSAPAAKVPSAAPAAAPATDAAPTLDPVGALGYRLEWRGYAVVSTGSRVKFFDTWSDAIVVHDTGNTVSVLEPQTGRTRWSSDLAADLIRYVGNGRAASGDLITCSETDVATLNIKSGDLVARQRFAELANTPPLIVGNMAIVGCVNGQVLGHNLTSGFKQWAYQLTGAINSPAVMTGEDAACVSGTGEVVVLSPAKGTSVGSTKVYAGITNTPVADDRSVYIAGMDQSIWSISRYNGGTNWRVRTAYPLTEQPALHDGRVYISIPKEGLACLDATNGSRIWTSAGADGRVIGVRNKRLVTWNGRTARTLDAVTGDVVDAVDLPQFAFASVDQFMDGNLYLAMPSGEVRKYSPKR